MSETAAAYEVFRYLWAIVEMGAVADGQSRSQPLQGVSVAAYAAAQCDELDRLREVVRNLARFSDETMEIFDRQSGWREGQESSMDLAGGLVLYAGCIYDYPAPIEDPVALRRMLDMGMDLQLAGLIDALVAAAIAGGTHVGQGSVQVLDAVRMAAVVGGRHHLTAAQEAVGLWRVALLPGTLRPDSLVPADFRASERDYAHALMDLVGI